MADLYPMIDGVMMGDMIGRWTNVRVGGNMFCTLSCTKTLATFKHLLNFIHVIGARTRQTGQQPKLPMKVVPEQNKLESLLF